VYGSSGLLLPPNLLLQVNSRLVMLAKAFAAVIAAKYIRQ
jgi:hypothetical protein